MGKSTMNVLSKMLLGMNVISQAILSMEDGKLTSSEMIQIFTVGLQGLGITGASVKGITFTQAEDGSIDLKIPADLVNKLNIKIY